MKELQGVIYALVTPMDKEENLNLDALKPVIEMNLRRFAKSAFSRA